MNPPTESDNKRVCSSLERIIEESGDFRAIANCSHVIQREETFQEFLKKLAPYHTVVCENPNQLIEELFKWFSTDSCIQFLMTNKADTKIILFLAEFVSAQTQNMSDWVGPLSHEMINYHDKNIYIAATILITDCFANEKQVSLFDAVVYMNLFGCIQDFVPHPKFGESHFDSLHCLLAHRIKKTYTPETKTKDDASITDIMSPIIDDLTLELYKAKTSGKLESDDFTRKLSEMMSMIHAKPSKKVNRYLTEALIRLVICIAHEILVDDPVDIKVLEGHYQTYHSHVGIFAEQPKLECPLVEEDTETKRKCKIAEYAEAIANQVQSVSTSLLESIEKYEMSRILNCVSRIERRAFLYLC